MVVFKNKKWWVTGIALMVFSLAAGCAAPPNEPLSEIADQIWSAMGKADQQVLKLQARVKALLEKPPGQDILFTKETRYKRYKGTVLYTPEEEGRCEVWASGKTPVDSALIRKIKRIENICPLLSRAFKILCQLNES
ncbi:MAG: hypothetical protein HUN05_05350 [Desulfobacter sp.]|nr:MAG: hypothetical protein HUN05_05350 [Desulfobacter sp.]